MIAIISAPNHAKVLRVLNVDHHIAEMPIAVVETIYDGRPEWMWQGATAQLDRELGNLTESAAAVLEDCDCGDVKHFDRDLAAMKIAMNGTAR